MATRIIVGNIPVNATEDALKEFFLQFGSVKDIVLPRNERGNAKGFATVTMSTRQEAVAAWKLRNTDYDGRRLTISLLQEEPSTDERKTLQFFRRLFFRS